jgi:hypothetical protein
LKTADVPQDSFFGGFSNSTPRAVSVLQVSSMSSVKKPMFENVPVRLSWPGGVNKASWFLSRETQISIQRWAPPSGWSVRI